MLAKYIFLSEIKIIFKEQIFLEIFDQRFDANSLPKIHLFYTLIYAQTHTHQSSTKRHTF